MMRKFPVMPGRIAWVDDVKPYPVPKGIHEGEEVTIVSMDQRTGYATVRKKNGKELGVWHAFLDTGWEYKIGERYFHESTLEAYEHLRKLLIDAETRPEHPAFPGSKQRSIDGFKKILRRNGRRVES
jgi:hypothetical protein